MYLLINSIIIPVNVAKINHQKIFVTKVYQHKMKPPFYFKWYHFDSCIFHDHLHILLCNEWFCPNGQFNFANKIMSQKTMQFFFSQFE